MAEGERRSAKLWKQSEIDQDEDDYPVSTVKTLVTKPGGDVCAPTVVSTGSLETTEEITALTKPSISRNKTLTRGAALEGTSPPPETLFSQLSVNGDSNHGNTSLVSNGGSTCLRSNNVEAKNFLLSSHENTVSNDSGRGTFEYTDGTSEKSLSRTSSTETSSTSQTSHTPSSTDPYKDASGIDLIDFFKQTLQKSPKDKKTLFALEKELHSFVRDDTLRTKKLHEMNPYDRMLVHRLAAHMGMVHNVDQPGKSVIVGKTEFTRIPEQTMNDYFKEIEHESQQAKKKILLKKPAHSLDERENRKSALNADNRTKSLDERQENYNRARQRIFKDEAGQPYPDGYPTQTLLTTQSFNNVTIQTSIRPNLVNASRSHHFKSADSVEPLHCAYLTTQHRRHHHMAKSNSYSGSTLQTLPTNPATTNIHNILSDAPYTSPPPLVCNQIPGTPQVMGDQATTAPTSQTAAPTTYAFLVSSDYSSIPVGSRIIDPNTMQPHVNGDGSEYKFDPTNPPPFMLTSQAPGAPPVDTNSSNPNSVLNPSDGTVSQISQPMVAGVPTGVADYPIGQAVSIVPPIMQQQVYPSPSQQHIQGQYLPASPGPGCQQSIRLIAINQGGPAPVEPQSQTTVPMPALQSYPLVSTPSLSHYQSMATVAPGQPDEMATSAAYPQLPDVLNGGAAHYLPNSFLAQQASAFTPQATQYVIQQQAAAGQTTFYTLPQSSSTPPPLLTQPPPSHQPANPHSASMAAPHQPPANSQMYSILQSPPAGTTLTYPQMSHQAAGNKSWPPGILAPAGYRPPSPPGQQMMGYMAPPQTQAQPNTQYLALQATATPHQRPLGTLIQLGAAQSGQQYVIRPFTALQGAALVRPHMPTTPVQHNQQSQHKHKSNGKHKKGKKTITPAEDDVTSSGTTLVSPLIPNTYIPPASSNRQ